MNLSGIKSIVFDMDGTLIHTTVDFRKMKGALVLRLETMGVPPHLRDPRDVIATILPAAESYLISEGRDGDLPSLRTWISEVMNRTELERVEETTPVRGAREVLPLLRERGYRLGLLTRGSRAYASEALRVAGLDIGFDAVVCRDDYPETEAKPNGVAMKRMADMLGVPVEQCLLVGDHLIDLSCARSSSARFVGVLTGAFGKEDWERAECVDVVDSVLSLPDLLRSAK